MYRDGLKEQLDRIERNVEALRGEVRDIVSADVKSGAKADIQNSALTMAIETLIDTMGALNASVKASHRPAWWESMAAKVVAVGITLLLVGRELAPLLGQFKVSP